LLQPPLPLPLIGEHVGAMLALIGTERGGGEPTTRAEIGLAERICDAIVQQCTDLSLSVEKIATPLNVSVRTLHRSLAGCGKTFGGVLLEARVNVAVRMLESPLLRSLTAAEIGRRAGFVDASHLARVVRARVGRSPAQLRPTGTREPRA
jgi:AraC-like DNA-binding protein